MSKDLYDSPLTSRYCEKSQLRTIFSERTKTEAWRQLWVWLAEAEQELGLPQITDNALEELRQHISDIDWETVRVEEKRLKHDVMAHNLAFGKVCPNAAGIIHLGATSCYVQDNADLIKQRDALDYILKKFAVTMQRLANFAEAHASVVTVGYTHLQAASLTTVGKRAVLWLQELLMSFQKIEHMRKTLRFRGIKGATGTQDSFLTLFKGDDSKVKQLDDIVTKKAGFDSHFSITGQTYARQQDADLIYALSSLGAAAHKIGFDIRFLQSHGGIMEPFEAEQIGSSAMPYKRNPMKCERICSLGTELMNSLSPAVHTYANQGLERTLDDSACRRLYIPDTFLLCDAILSILQNVFEGLNVPEGPNSRAVQRELPTVALEKALMLLTELGVSRQEAHAKIRDSALYAKQQLDSGAKATVNLADVLADPFYDGIRKAVVELAAEPLKFTGAAVRQTVDFIREEFQPVVRPYLTESDLKAKSVLDV